MQIKTTLPRFNSSSRCCGLALAAVLTTGSLVAQPSGQWDFSNGNLTATVGTDLQYADGTGGLTQSGTSFGSTTSFGIPGINATAVNVMKFPAATNSMGYFMTAPPNGNAGGNLVNDYTLIYDLLYPQASTSQLRPLIDTDGGIFYAGPEVVVSSSNGVGTTPSGPYGGVIAPNTWYRIGIVVQQDQNLVTIYVNGSKVASTTVSGTQAGRDGRFGLPPGGSILILGNTDTNAAPGYVSSIQIRDAALNPGQMLALGGPSASKIPQTIPPVPAFIQSSTPGAGDTGVGPLPRISIVLNQGDTTVDSSSINLLFDGVALTSTVTATAPTFQITSAITNILDPSSIHKLSLVWHDSVAGTTTNSWLFTVVSYQNVTLPTPFYLETFDELSENVSGPTPLPSGWAVTNQTWPEHAGFSLDDLKSDTYKDWVLITNTREFSWETGVVGEPQDRGDLPPIVLNGQMLNITNFLSGNLMWAESDQRPGNSWGQYQEMYTADIDCSGRTNVYVAFNSFYEQNQDNMNLVEYSIDKGTNWLPVRYLFCTLGNGEQSDIYYTNDASGNPVIDIGKTFLTVDANRSWAPWPAGCTDLTVCPASHGTNYGYYVKAPITTNLIPYIKGYTNDDTMSSKEIIVVRLAQADGQKTVRFRFLDDGTSSWFWGIDNLGLYEINTPVIGTQPQSQTVDAGTPVTFSVAAVSAKPLTYQWQFNGVNIPQATNLSYTISSVAPNQAGQYKVIVKNSDGNTPSAPATLTVNTNPVIAGPLVSQVADAGTTVTFSPSTSGGRPLTYLWYFGGIPIPGSSPVLTRNSVSLADIGDYQLVLSNSFGMVTSTVARLTVVSGPITNALVAHLTFDGNLTDTSGRGNNATYATNGTAGDPNPTFVPGKIGQAFEYTTLIDGTKFDYATFGYPPDLMLDTNSFSVSMWVNYTNQNDDLPFISNKDWNSSGNRGWGMFSQSGGNFRLNLTGPNGGADKFSTSPATILRDGTWHNLIMSVVRDSAAGTITAYVDGAAVYQGTLVTQGSIDTAGLPFQNEQSRTSGQTTCAVNIGQDGTGVYFDQGSAYNINAKIDDLGIWRRALTSGEASAIYTAGQAGKDLSQAKVAPVTTKPTVTINAVGSSLKITWQGTAIGRLQTTTSLNPANWTDVPGTTGASSATVSASSNTAFFRFKQ